MKQIVTKSYQDAYLVEDNKRRKLGKDYFQYIETHNDEKIRRVGSFPIKTTTDLSVKIVEETLEYGFDYLFDKLFVSWELTSVLDEFSIYRCVLWMKTDDHAKHYYVRYIDNTQLNVSELQNRYDRVRCIDCRYKKTFEFKKPVLDKISKIAYMWNSSDNKIRDLDKDKLNLVLKYPTFHKYNYHGWFKPDLQEVLTQLPEKVFEYDEIYVTTEMISDSMNQLVVGEYHVGVTSVYLYG